MLGDQVERNRFNMNELEKLTKENESIKKVLFTMYDLIFPELPKLMKKIKSKEIQAIEENLLLLGHTKI